jgi:hypothetical protein
VNLTLDFSSQEGISSISKSSKNSKTTDNSILSFIKQVKASSMSTTPNNFDSKYINLSDTKWHPTIGIHFSKEESLREKKNKNKNSPFTHTNIREPNKKVSFAIEQVYSPQAKILNSLSKTKKKKRKKDNLNSTKTFLRKRLGEERFREIMKSISVHKNFDYGSLNDILTPVEKYLRMFIFSVLKNDTPKTGSSFGEAKRRISRFGDRSKK